MTTDDRNLINKDIADVLLEATAPVEPTAAARVRMKDQLFDRIGESASRDAEDLITVKAATSEWLETSPGNQVKVLRSDVDSMSILVRLEPGTTFPAHYHPADEETYVVEGETWFGDIHLSAGDFHLAPQGTTHGEVRTETGCVLLIRKAAD